jgi:ABC-2 type transport system ATP-binding protein
VSGPALEARALRKAFGAKVAVRALTLSVPRGEVFGFLGPNGAGKTTSMKMLLGLVHPSGGTGRVLGTPLGDPRGRARIGYLPEHFAFHEWLLGRELMRFHARLLGLPARGLDGQIADRLRRVGLGDAAERRLREYSKGMKQRLGLAQAMLGEPELVFLDEPTSGLDPLGRRLVRDVIRELKSRGTAVFLNSHLLSEVEVTCDRVAFVKDGRVVREMALGATERDLQVEMRLDRSSPALLAGLGGFGRDVREAAGQGTQIGELPSGQRLLTRSEYPEVHMRVDGEERLPEITRWLAGQGVGLYQLAARRPSLEEVFLEVMGDVPLAG